MLQKSEQIRACALRLLARREHSKQELQNKLLARGFSKQLILDIITDLAQNNLQSDERFAANYVKMRSERGFGPIKIIAELRQKGIDTDLIERSVEPNAQEWRMVASKAREKKFASEWPKDFQETVKQLKFLQQRGFKLEKLENDLNE